MVVFSKTHKTSLTEEIRKFVNQKKKKKKILYAATTLVKKRQSAFYTALYTLSDDGL